MTLVPGRREQSPNEVFAIVLGVSVALHAVLAFSVIPQVMAADRDSAPEHSIVMSPIEASTAPFELNVTPPPVPAEAAKTVAEPAKTAGPAETPAIAKGTPPPEAKPAKHPTRPKVTRKRTRRADAKTVKAVKPSPIATPASPETAASAPAPSADDADQDSDATLEAVADAAPHETASPASAAPSAAPGHEKGTANVGGGDDDRVRLKGYLRSVHRSLQRGAVLPRGSARGERGVVLVEFVINDALEIIDVRVKRSSGSSLLDRTAVKHVRRLGHLPRPPAGLRLDRKVLTVPIRFA